MKRLLMIILVVVRIFRRGVPEEGGEALRSLGRGDFRGRRQGNDPVEARRHSWIDAGDDDGLQSGGCETDCRG